MTTQHTPTPWTLMDAALRAKLVDEDGEFISHLSSSRYHDDRSDPIAQANARFIVTACNAHDALTARVAELEAVAREVDRFVIADYIRAVPNSGATDALYALRAALAAGVQQ